MTEFTELTVPDLKRKHKALSKKIKQLQSKPAFDSLEMGVLKKRRANIKERIAALGGNTSGMAREVAAHKQSPSPKSRSATSVVFMLTKRPPRTEGSEPPVRVSGS